MADKNPKEKMTPAKKKSLRIAVIKQMVTLSTAGFGLVSALAWNNVIQEFVNEYIKKYLTVGSGIISLLIYAVLITLFAVIITYQLTKIVERLDQE